MTDAKNEAASGASRSDAGLERCPFCGESPNPPMLMTGDTYGWAVWCGSCGGQGPAIQGHHRAATLEAKRRWNKRSNA